MAHGIGTEASDLERLRERLDSENRARLEAESALQTLQHELGSAQQEIELLRSLGRLTHEVHSVDEALRLTLQAVGAFVGYPLGHVYRLARQGAGELLPSDLWHARDKQRFEPFLEATRLTPLAPGMGLPGRVLLQRAPLWSPEVSREPGFSRAASASASGLRLGFAFPVLVGQSVEAVLEFYSDQAHPAPDERLLDLLRHVGTQLGRVFERHRLEEQLLHDALTGLPNRALFMDRLGLAFKYARRRQDYSFAVLFLDIDRFKVITDSLGPAIGDQLLAAVARRVAACLRPADTVARLGGDEFAILLSDVTEPSDAIRVANRVHRQLDGPWSFEQHEVFASVSIGIALSSPRYEHPEDILRDADNAMHRAKALGRARHQVFDHSMHVRALCQLEMESDLRRAVERDEFIVYYQPIISLATGMLEGFEALVRWQHPQRGLVGPTEFIPVAEETGLIVPLSYRVLREACLQTRIWQERFPSVPPLSMSCNLSTRLFSQPDLVQQIRQVIHDSGLDPRSLKLEITESAIMSADGSAMPVLDELRALGATLALDDFGTGYSSLSYLHRFPIDTLKIDRSFVSRMGHGEKSSELARTITALGHHLGMSVVAEGVETAEQLSALRELRCEGFQGYFFSRPLPPQAAEQLLASRPHW